MTPDEVLKYCLENLEGTVLVNSWGERGGYYNPDNILKRGVYILTVKEKDGDNDKSSNLNRKNIYRMELKGRIREALIKMILDFEIDIEIEEE